MESGIGSGLGLDQTAPVGDVAGGQNQVSPQAGEREERRRRPEPEKKSTDAPADSAAPADAAQVGEGGEGEDQPPPHRVDSLA